MSSKIKVLYIPSWYPNRHSASIGQFFRRQALALREKYELIVLYVGFSPLNKEKFETECSREDGLTVYRIYIKGNVTFFISNIFDLRNLLIAYWKGFRIIKKEMGYVSGVHICVTDPAGLIGFLWFKLKRIPYIIYDVSSVFLQADGRYYSFKRFRKYLIALVIRNAKAIAVVATPLKNAMLRHKLRANYFIIPPTAFERKEFFPPQKKNSSLIKMLHVSNLDARAKNPRLMIKAVYEVSKIRTDFVLDIVTGNKEMKRELEKYAEELNIRTGLIRYHENKKNDAEIGDIMRQADFFILTSNYDTFATVVSESLACGVPAIITRCEGPEDYVTEECGIIAEPGNEEQMIKAVLYMLDNHQKYNRQKIAAYAQQKFSKETFVKQVGDLYEKYFAS